MLGKIFRNLFGAAATLLLVSFALPARAVVYDIGFDPFDFGGIMRINVPPSCFIPFPADNACGFDVLSGSFSDSLNRMWNIPSAPGIGAFVRLNATDTLVGILPSNGGHHDCVIIPTKLEHMKHTRSCTL